MPIELFRTSRLRAPKATILVYAPARWGKTYLARTVTKPLIVATEIGDTSGLLTLNDLDLPAIRIHKWTDMKDLFINHLQKVPGKCQFQGEEFDAVLIDSLTGCGELWVEAGMAILGWDMAFDLSPKKDPRRMYSYVAEKGRQAMKMFFETHAHLIFLCREGLIQEGEGETAVYYNAPELPGQKLPKELPGWPDASLHGMYHNGQRVFATQNQGKTVSGFRTSIPNLPKYIKPNLNLIIKMMLGDASVLPELDATKK